MDSSQHAAILDMLVLDICSQYHWLGYLNKTKPKINYYYWLSVSM